MAERMNARERIEEFTELRQKSSGTVERCRKHWRAMDDVYDGNQYDEADIAALSKDKRPSIVNNVSAPLVDTLVGIEINNRKGVYYYPTTPGSNRCADMMNAVARYVYNRANIDFHESQAFKDVIKGGLGVTNTYMDYSGMNSELGELMTKRIDPKQMFWDTNASEQNLMDARWVACERVFHAESEIRARFPNASDEDIKSLITSGTSMSQPNFREIRRERTKHVVGRDDAVGVPDDALVVYEWQYFNDEPYYEVENPFQDGAFLALVQSNPEILQPLQEKLGEEFVREIMLLTPAQWAWAGKFTKQIEGVTGLQLTMSGIRLYKRHYYKSFLNGNVELQHSENATQGGFTYKFMTGKRDGRKKYYYGILRAVSDLQRVVNKTYNSMIEALTAQSKGGLLLGPSNAGVYEEVRQKWSRSDAVILLDDLDGWREKPQSKLQHGMMELFNVTNQFVSVVGMVRPEMMGMSAPGIRSAEQQTQRTQQGMNMTSEFFDAKTMYNKEWGRMLVEFTKEYLADPRRMVRIGSDYGDEPVPLLTDDLADDYDIMVDQAPVTTNQKQQVFEATMGVIQSVAPNNPQLAQALTESLIDYAPLPAKITASVKQKLMALQQPDPMAQEMQQIEVEDKKADIEKKRSAAVQGYARARKTEIEADASENEEVAKNLGALQMSGGVAGYNGAMELQ